MPKKVKHVQTVKNRFYFRVKYGRLEIFFCFLVEMFCGSISMKTARKTPGKSPIKETQSARKTDTCHTCELNFSQLNRLFSEVAIGNRFSHQSWPESPITSFFACAESREKIESMTIQFQLHVTNNFLVCTFPNGNWNWKSQYFTFTHWNSSHLAFICFPRKRIFFHPRNLHSFHT